MRSSVWPTRVVVLTTGALPILAFPRADLGWMAWVALAPAMLLLASARTGREAAIRGWVFGVGYLLGALYWTLPYIGPALPLIAVVFGGLWGPWGMAVRALIPRHPAYALLVLPSSWLAIELVRSRPSLGGPWAVYGATQWQHPTELSLASIGGVWLITFALVAANTALTLALTTLQRIAAHPVQLTNPNAMHPAPASPTGGSQTKATPQSAYISAAVTASGPVHNRETTSTDALESPGADANGRHGHNGPPDVVGDGRQPAIDGTGGGAKREDHEGGATPDESAADESAARGESETPGGDGGGRRRASSWLGPPGGGRRRFMVGMVVLALAIVGIGPLIFSLRGEPETTRTMRMNLVQPGSLDGVGYRLSTGFRLTTSAPPADLTVWGESSVSVDLDRSPTLVRRLRELAAARGPLLVNVDAEDGDGRISKTAVLVDRDGIRGRYTKTRLVPFGEYIPFRRELGWLTRISKAAGQDRAPGTGPTVLKVGDTTFGPLICFESAFPDLGRTLTRRGAEVIVYQSSTSSFQNTWAPAQHASLAAVRAAETGRPVVQAALTGVSAAFDARGRRIAWFDTDRKGVVTVTLGIPPASSRTPYDRVGDVVPLVSLIITAAAILTPVWKRRKEV